MTTLFEWYFFTLENNKLCIILICNAVKKLNFLQYSILQSICKLNIKYYMVMIFHNRIMYILRKKHTETEALNITSYFCFGASTRVLPDHEMQFLPVGWKNE